MELTVEILEHQATLKDIDGLCVPQSFDFTPVDILTVEYHPDWIEGTRFEYFHNGVKIDRDRALELVPGSEIPPLTY